MIKCAIIGATGFTGMELIKILVRHPGVRITHLTTRQDTPIPVRNLIPVLPPGIDLEIVPYSFTDVKKNADVVFVCLPHTEAAETVKEFRRANKIVIDLSADFRLKGLKEYERWYKVEHPCPELVKEAVYGLPELYREKIKQADLIANPGCYPTGVILALAPLLKNKLIERDSMIVDAASGVSGAGKKLDPATQFIELEENYLAYKVNKHQHMPEMREVLETYSGAGISLTFVPHLLPVKRGILATIYLQRRKNVSARKIEAALKAAYDKEPFVRLRPEGNFPALRDVQGTNYCDIGFTTDPQSDRVILVTAIDNLLKGASGQAVQNMNIRMEFAEDEGLKLW
ncbi:MAG: N-acetyl-gamma-glutamyl-phosphate reductase [Candidatus Omnitrophica bacterium]|nr:N-acetyl-gamma-glutamyl-phosphate reductase [Candidatus Omnitrophota bacterium]MDD5672043.1 N-acetyl-gamma-glutamyl-phosphate reductase [Candidatus Omnitrophota bacterium]